MPLKSVAYISRRDAESKQGTADYAIISISEPFSYPAQLSGGWHSVLRLEFHDIEQASWPQTLFSRQDACDIAAFVEQAQDCEGILVQCKAGISRSAAIAKWIAEKFSLPFDHAYGLYNRRVYNTLCEIASQDRGKQNPS